MTKMKKGIIILSSVLASVFISFGMYYKIISFNALDGEVHFSEEAALQVTAGSDTYEATYTDGHYSMAMSLNNRNQYTLVIAQKQMLSWVKKEVCVSPGRQYVYVDQNGNDIYVFGILSAGDAQSVLLTAAYSDPIEPQLCQKLQAKLCPDMQSIIFVFKIKSTDIISPRGLALVDRQGNLLTDSIWCDKNYIINVRNNLDVSYVLQDPNWETVFQDAVMEITNQENKKFDEPPLVTPVVEISCYSMDSYTINWDIEKRKVVLMTYSERISISKMGYKMWYSFESDLVTSTGHKGVRTKPQRVVYRFKKGNAVDALFDLIPTK